MTKTKWFPMAMVLVLAGAGGLPRAAEAQFGVPAAARALYRAPLLGPSRYSAVEAGWTANLPDPAAGCSLSGIGWTYPNCWPTFQSDGVSRESAQGAALEERIGFSSQAQGSIPCFFELDIDPLQQCGTAAGARAAADFGENRVFASARGAESFTREGTNTGDPGAPLEEVEYYFEPSALATSQWVAELTPTFTGWLFMAIGVELHPAARPLLNQTLANGSGTLALALFEKPDNLVAPPLREGVGPGDDDYETGWTYYGRNEDTRNTSANGWGWNYVGAESHEISALGVTPIYAGFNVMAGTTYSLVVNLTAGASLSQVADFWGTARLNGFEVEDGIDPAQALTFDCGSADCPSFTVRTVGESGGPTAPVPEPSTLSLLAGGVLVTMLARRRR